MTELGLNLDETITAAVKARIEAEVLAALSGDAVIGQFVAAAMQAQVESKRGYNTIQEPYLTKVLREAIQSATKEAVARLLVEEVGRVEDEVRKALRRDLSKIAGALAQNLAEVAGRPYGLDVSLALKMPNSS